MRIDNAKAGLTIKYLCDKLDNLNIYVLDNSNINENHLGRKGLNLNGMGTGRLAMNIISDITVNTILNPKSSIFTPRLLNQELVNVIMR